MISRIALAQGTNLPPEEANMNRDALAKVLGHALVNQDFATKLTNDPASAGHSIGVHLDAQQVKALKGIDVSKLAVVGTGIRDKLGPLAVLDQQQNVQQAMMD
jgi:hypothetical protein